MTSLQRRTFAVAITALVASLSIAPTAFAADAMHDSMHKGMMKKHGAMHKDAMKKDTMMKKDDAPSQ